MATIDEVVDPATTEKKEKETVAAVVDDEVDCTIGEEAHQLSNPLEEEVQAY